MRNFRKASTSMNEVETRNRTGKSGELRCGAVYHGEGGKEIWESFLISCGLIKTREYHSGVEQTTEPPVTGDKP